MSTSVSSPEEGVTVESSSCHNETSHVTSDLTDFSGSKSIIRRVPVYRDPNNKIDGRILIDAMHEAEDILKYCTKFQGKVMQGIPGINLRNRPDLIAAFICATPKRYKKVLKRIASQLGIQNTGNWVIFSSNVIVHYDDD